MLIRIAQKNLPRAIGPPFAREAFCAQGVQVPFPRVEVVHLLGQGATLEQRPFAESEIRDGRLYLCGALVA